MSQGQDIWNKRWTDRNFSDGWAADSWLIRHRHRLGRGDALDIACGRGRNALLLAESGYRVTAVDYSGVALKQLEQEAHKRGLQVETIHCDLEQQPELPQKQFDLIINFFYLHRPLLPQLLLNVKPGGWLLSALLPRPETVSPANSDPRWFSIRVNCDPILPIGTFWSTKKVWNHPKKAEPWPVSSPENPHERKITHAPNRGLTNEAIKL